MVNTWDITIPELTDKEREWLKEGMGKRQGLAEKDK